MKSRGIGSHIFSRNRDSREVVVIGEYGIEKALSRSTIKALLAILVLLVILPLLIMEMGSYALTFFSLILMVAVSLIAMVEYRKDKEAYRVLTSFIENIAIKGDTLIIHGRKMELGHGRFYSRAVYGRISRIRNFFYISNKYRSNIIELERVSKEFTLLSDFMGDYANIPGVKVLSKPYENVILGIINPKTMKLRVEPQTLILQAKGKTLAEARLKIENSKIRAILYAYPGVRGVVYLKLHGGVPERRVSITLGSVGPGEQCTVVKHFPPSKELLIITHERLFTVRSLRDRVGIYDPLLISGFGEGNYKLKLVLKRTLHSALSSEARIFLEHVK